MSAENKKPDALSHPDRTRFRVQVRPSAGRVFASTVLDALASLLSRFSGGGRLCSITGKPPLALDQAGEFGLELLKEQQALCTVQGRHAVEVGDASLEPLGCDWLRAAGIRHESSFK